MKLHFFEVVLPYTREHMLTPSEKLIMHDCISRMMSDLDSVKISHGRVV